MKILVVENDALLTERMELFLKTEGHWCEVYNTPAPALASVASRHFDSIVFNLSSLDNEELNFLKFLRSNKLNKKTILTFEENKLVNQNKVEGLEMVNLQKPYPLHALHAQINQIIHHENFEDQDTISFNELMVDVPGRVVRVKNQDVELTRREYDLLLYLISNKSRVLSKNTLAQYLAKDAEDLSDFGFLYAHIKNLKKKLKAAGCADYIKTIYGIGYKFQH